MYLVDVVDADDSSFFESLGIAKDNYVQASWCDFMEQAGHRILADHVADLQRACANLCEANQYESEDLTAIIGELSALGIVSFGQIRSRWLLHDRSYATHNEFDHTLVADIMLAIAMLERVGAYRPQISQDGSVTFWQHERLAGKVGFVSGHGSLTWYAIESKIKHDMQYFGISARELPQHFIVSGIEGGKPATSAVPENITGDRPAGNIVTCDDGLSLHLLSDLRQDEGLVNNILAH